MERENDICEKEIAKVLRAETFRDRAEGLAEGKPSLGAAREKVDEISGAVTLRERIRTRKQLQIYV